MCEANTELALNSGRPDSWCKESKGWKWEEAQSGSSESECEACTVVLMHGHGTCTQEISAAVTQLALLSESPSLWPSFKALPQLP